MTFWYFSHINRTQRIYPKNEEWIKNLVVDYVRRAFQMSFYFDRWMTEEDKRSIFYFPKIL